MSTAQSIVPVDAEPDDRCALAVLGMLAYSELAEFSRLAADAALAPSLDQRLELSRLSGNALARLDRIGERVAELGGELRPVMEPFAGVLVEFDRRTEPSTWWERLLKGYVGYGVADDFARFIAQALDPQTRDLVVEVLRDDGHANLVVESLAGAVAEDATLASRLALWGRRLVGESLNVVQGVLTAHPEMRPLLARAFADPHATDVLHPSDAADDVALPEAAPSGPTSPDEMQQRLFSILTAEHSRRMGRLGLTP